MKNVNVKKMSSVYETRLMTKDDVSIIYNLCVKNKLYYKYFHEDITKELVEEDLTITPPGISIAQKYYMGFFKGDTLVAVMDLIDGYPKEEIAFIGFFMMNTEFQGKEAGSSIISEVMSYLKEIGYSTVRLAIIKENPQATHFWAKNKFEVIDEVKRGEENVLIAERKL